MLVKCKYEVCQNNFEYKYFKKYCCRNCKQKDKDKRLGNTNNKNKKRKRPYVVHKKDKCDFCGFIPIHMCQLDVDHIDGNNKNNDISNLQTLCANCHRLKTYKNKDWEQAI